MNADVYESALRYIFGGGRHTANGLADADVFREAVQRDDWRKVVQGLSLAIKRLKEGATTVEWSDVRLQQEVEFALGDALLHLKNSQDKEYAHLVFCRLLYSVKALLSDKGASAAQT